MRAVAWFMVLAMVVSCAHAYNYYWQTKIDGKGLVGFDTTLVMPKVPVRGLVIKVGLYPSTAPLPQEHHRLLHTLSASNESAPSTQSQMEVAPSTQSQMEVDLQGKTATKTPATKTPATKTRAKGAKAAAATPAGPPDAGTPAPGASPKDGSQDGFECVISQSGKAPNRAFTEQCGPGMKIVQGKSTARSKGAGFQAGQSQRLHVYLTSKGAAQQRWATGEAQQGGPTRAAPGSFTVKPTTQFNIFKITITTQDSNWGKSTSIHLAKLTLEYEVDPSRPAASEKSFCPSSATEEKKHHLRKLVVNTPQGLGRVQAVRKSASRLKTKQCVLKMLALTTSGGMKSGENATEDAEADEAVNWEETNEFILEQEAADAAELEAQDAASSSGGSAAGVVLSVLAVVTVVGGVGAYVYLKKRKAAAAATEGGAATEGASKAQGKVKHQRLPEDRAALGRTTSPSAHPVV